MYVHSRENLSYERSDVFVLAYSCMVSCFACSYHCRRYTHSDVYALLRRCVSICSLSKFVTSRRSQAAPHPSLRSVPHNHFTHGIRRVPLRGSRDNQCVPKNKSLSPLNDLVFCRGGCGPPVYRLLLCTEPEIHV